MKALILAAGFGTRLLPYTQAIPKPLLTINSMPVIRLTIEKLINAGCSEIIINTHHLHDQIENYFKINTFPIKIKTVFEPVILDTGGAVKNIKSLIKDSTFIVINSDILFDINLTEIIKAHHDGKCLASLVLHKHEKFNQIEIDENNFIISFDSLTNPYAFTGIHILSSEIFNLMPDKDIFSIIDFYKNLINNKKAINAFVLKKAYFWEDIGTIDTYKHSSMKYLTSSIERPKENNINQMKIQKLTGDGSDREWFRIETNKKTYIAADHGINTSNTSNTTFQLDSFINIGNHLYNKKLPVPKILNFDTFSGIAIVEDLGNKHLETIINNSEDNETIFNWYKKVCDALFSFSKKGLIGFNKKWTFETEEYSKEVILEKECKYFIDAFANKYLKKNVEYKTFLDEFEFIADNCTDSSFKGLMHRDMQSKNIMVKNNFIYFIDFQSARKGPLEYDMASLLIDPYVKLEDSLKEQILEYFLDIIVNNNIIDAKHFKHCYKYCCITRNLQILGAFSYLSKVKNKKRFEAFIPFALASLKEHINLINIKKIPKLNKFINSLEI
ncbi:MAG: phosphotransferase [Desulfobacterales bacterium]|nr:phosphotransferase [Desulfobacterales bacterium]